VAVLTMMTLRSLPLSFRALASSFLIVIGIGYLTALSLLFLVDIKPNVGAGKSVVEDISEHYHGVPSSTRLETALGPMSTMASPDERNRIFKWIHAGAPQNGYAAVAPIFKKECLLCHNPQNNYSIPPLTSYEEVKKLVKTNTGENIIELARFSHIHRFGISLIFMITGSIFTLSETPVWVRVTLVVIPYLTIVMDIGSWWLTKYLDPAFAYVVLIGGAGMGIALAAQIFVPLWQMWIDPLKAAYVAIAAPRPRRRRPLSRALARAPPARHKGPGD
jgi:hypothetical protein